MTKHGDKKYMAHLEQDRESYTDTQDRKHYTTEDAMTHKEAYDEGVILQRKWADIERNTMTQHTPGPWTVDGLEIKTRGSQGQYEAIAKVMTTYGGEVEHANARLIAAAPELYASIEQALAVVATDNGKETYQVVNEMVDILQTALAKVKI